jgi:hypothetical protein
LFFQMISPTPYPYHSTIFNHPKCLAKSTNNGTLHYTYTSILPSKWFTLVTNIQEEWKSSISEIVCATKFWNKK